MRTKFVTPRKGSKSRLIARMLLRREGATVQELRTATDMSSVVIHGVVSRLNFDCGFDIRGFAGRPMRYKIVGRAKWRGGYRSFIEGSE